MRILDLFCGAGGAAMGYQRAGFHVTGVDVALQPNYCGDEFVQADALGLVATFPWWEVDAEFDAIHASPPCQHYAGSTAWRGSRANHPNLIPPTQELLRASGLPYVLENVPDARRLLRHPLKLCGTAFGLPIRRHRYFELSWEWPAMAHPCHHQASDLPFEHKGERAFADAMGCGWMTNREAREAIPPAFTEHIGHYLRLEIKARRARAAA